MAVSTTDTYSGPYAANGSTVEFPFTFKAASASEVDVILRSVGVDSSILSDEYTVTLSDNGGTVLFPIAPSGGDIYIVSDPSFRQEISFSSGQAYRPETVNEANDRAAIRDLAIKGQINRGIRVPVGEDMPELPPAEMRAGSALGFDGDGGLAVIPQAPIAGDGYDDYPFTIEAGDSVISVVSAGDNPFDIWLGGVHLTAGSDYDVAGSNAILDDPVSRDLAGFVRVHGAALLLQAQAARTSYAAMPRALSGTVGAKLQQSRNPLDRPYQAAGNGTTNDRAAIAAADADGPFTITGNHRISSSITINSRVTFTALGRLTIDTGVTVTFAGGVDAPDRQIFYGSGSVAGLSTCKAAWFAGDARGTATNARALLQKAFDACVQGGSIDWDGSYTSDGSAYIVASKGQNIAGAGRTKAKLLFSGAACLGINITTIEGAKVSGITFEPSSPNTIPTSGDAVRVEAVNCTVEKCFSSHCYTGVHWLNVNGGKDLDNNFNGAMYSACNIDNSPNIEVVSNNSSAFSDWVDLSTTTGFLDGESVSFSGGGSGSYGYTTSGTRAKIVINDGLPAASETMTGATSGTVATITAVTVGHRGGGLRLWNYSPGFNITGSAWAGGDLPGMLDGPSAVRGNFPEYGVIEGCYFDFGINGALLVGKCNGSRFTGNWMSSRSNSAVILDATHSNTINANTIAHSWESGILIGVNAKFTNIIGNEITGNNRSNTGKPGIFVSPNATDFVIQGNTIGKGTAPGYDGTQVNPVIVSPGSSDRYVIKNNLVSGNASSTIVETGVTGVNKAVGENY